MSKFRPNSCELAPRLGEPPVAWHERVRPLIPLMPKEVAEQWLHRHWGGILDYHSLVISTLVFRREHWITDRLSEIIGPNGQDPTFCMKKGEYLADFMRTHGTWPVPIIVLDNSRPSVEAAQWGTFGRMQLLEGHRRLSFVRQLISSGESNASHAVWVCAFPLDATARIESWNPQPPPKQADEEFDPSNISPITEDTPINCVPQELFDDLTDEENGQIERHPSQLMAILESVRRRLIEVGKP